MCGGCHYQHIRLAEQLRLKKEILRETLSRLGGDLNGTAAIAGTFRGALWLPQSRAVGVRDAGCRGRSDIFCRRARMIVPIDECPVLSPRLAETFLQLQELARPAIPCRREFWKIEAFADSADEKIALNVAFERFPKPAKAAGREFKGRCRIWRACCCWIRSKDRFELDRAGLFDPAGGGIQLSREPSFVFPGESISCRRFAADR